MSSKTKPENHAAYLTGKNSPFSIKSAPYTAPSENEIVIKVHAIAVNPFDKVAQGLGTMALPWLKYPAIIGSDVAGTIFEVGPGVTRFKPGDRVVGHAIGIDKHSNRAAEGGFQEYVVLRYHLASHIPDDLAFEKACVLPLTLSTAGCGLFMEKGLAMDLPNVKTEKHSKGETLVVWGGSTSVGSNAIQLAVAAGYEVITTAGSKNFDYVKKLGASRVFDYKSPTAIPDVIAAMIGKKSAGAIAIGDGSTSACISIVTACNGRKVISSASMPQAETMPPTGLAMVSFLLTFAWFFGSTAVRCRLNGIRNNSIWGTDIIQEDLGKPLYADFLPRALAEGSFVAAPEPLIVGNGLEILEEALDVVWKGVSARKVVITL